jgi:competence protein ComK
MTKKKDMNEEYEMNPLTAAIVPLQYGSKLFSQIHQLDQELYSPLKPLELIKLSCRLFGSGYEGRKEGSRQLIGITHKIPIIIDATNRMYFFPTTSPTNPQCSWISHEHVLRYEEIDATNTLITFRNMKTLVIPISVYSFENQMLRTAFLQTKLMQRIDGFNRKSTFFHRNHSKASEHKPGYGGEDLDVHNKEKGKENKKGKKIDDVED